MYSYRNYNFQNLNVLWRFYLLKVIKAKVSELFKFINKLVFSESLSVAKNNAGSSSPQYSECL